MGVDLLASGRDVPLIVLIDSYFPRPEIELNRADRVAQFFSSATMGEGVRCNASDLEHLLEPPYDGDRARFVARVGEEAARLEPIPGLGAADVQRLYAVFEANLDACSRYRPGRYAGRALSMRATRTNERAARGWRELIADFREEPLTGDHYSIMREPGVSELNETLRRELSFSQASADAVATATAHRAREEGARQELARGLSPEGRA
jgi:thioesterase domain-containing protein